MVLGTVPNDPSAQAQPLPASCSPLLREAFNRLRINLQHVDQDHAPRSLVVTSAEAGEGRTTIACGLAVAMAQAGSKVLLLDADLRRPRIAEYLGLEAGPGLAAVLRREAELDQAVVRWKACQLDVLPSGNSPSNPGELLASPAMRDLMTELRRHYDAIVIDTPPSLPVADAAILASDADGVLLVVRCGHTDRDLVAAAVKNQRQVNAHVTGTVLNFVPSTATGRAGYKSQTGGLQDDSQVATMNFPVATSDEPNR